MIVGSQGFRATQFLESGVVVTDPSQAQSAVAAQIQLGVDFIKIHEDLAANVYSAVADAAREFQTPFLGHAPFPVGTDGVLAEGQIDIEHVPSVMAREVLRDGVENGWWNSPDIDPAKVDVVAQRLAGAGVTLTPTLATLRAMLTPEEEAAFPSRPEARFIPPQQLENWKARGPWAPGEIRPATIANEEMAAKRMHDAGVRLIVGSDAGFTYTIHDELEMLVEAGLTTERALLAATRRSS